MPFSHPRRLGAFAALLLTLPLSAAEPALWSGLGQTKAASAVRTAKAGPGRNIFVLRNDFIVPLVLLGGGFSTELQIINMTIRPEPVPFRVLFFNAEGRGAEVNVLDPLTGRTASGASFSFSTPTAQGIRLQVTSPATEAQTLWAVIDYDTENARLGGTATVRIRAQDDEREAIVPISGADDSVFYMPFDNSGPVSNLLSLVNLTEGGTNVRLLFVALDGTNLGEGAINLAPGQQRVLSLQDEFRSTLGRSGLVVVEASTPFLAAAGLRVNNKTFTLTYIPVLNWSGMFRQ